MAALSVALVLLTTASALAASNYWTGRGAQSVGQAIYGGVNNWNGGSPASGAGNTAYYTNTFVNGYVCIINYEAYFPLGSIWYNDPADATDFLFSNAGYPAAYISFQVSSGFPVINVLQGDRTVTMQPAITGTNGLAKVGPGTLILANANTYTGWTVVSNGTLKLATASEATTAVIVYGGTTNVALVTATGGQLTIPGPWTNADNSAVVIDYGTNYPSTTVPAVSVTSLALGTNVTLQINGNSFVAGQALPLINWAGGTGPTNLAAFTNNLITPPGIGGNFTIANSTLYFNVTSSREPLTWNTGSGVWDTNTPNWLDANLATATYLDTKDLVLLDDATGVTGNPTVTLNATLSPWSVTLNSTSHNYTLSGPGGIAGGASLTLDPANTQTLTLATTNSYSGNTTINAGTLQLGSSNALPSGPGLGGFTVNAGGTLDLNTFSAGINSLNGGGVVDTVAGGSPTLTVGANNSQSVFSGVLQNTAGNLNLVKIGTGQLSLRTPNTFTGTVTVNGGILSFADPNSLSTVSGITLGGGTALSPDLPAAAVAVINAPITLGGSGTTAQINGNKAANGNLILNGPITGSGNLTFEGVNVGAETTYTILNAQSTYTGNTLINCDTPGNAGINMYVQLGIDNALPTNTVLTLDGQGTTGRTVFLDLNGFNQTLAGLNNVPEPRYQQILNSSATPATLTVNNTNNYTFSGQLGFGTSANFGLTKSGAGTLAIIGTNSYTGPTAINGGELVFSATWSGFGPLATDITVATGATNALLVDSVGAQWANPNSLTQANGSALAINYGSYLPSTTIAPSQVNTLTLGTGLTLQISGVGFVTGQSYPLLTWTGSGPADASGFTTRIQPARVTGTLSVSGSTLYYNVTSSPEPLSWNSGNGSWDNTSPNWVDATLTSAVYTDTHDLVVFDDASGVTGNPTVTLNTQLAPLGVTIKSSSHNYTFSGAGGIVGSAALTLDAANTHTLTLATANNYTGPTAVNGGTLNLSGTINGSSLTISNNAVFTEASTGVIAGSGVSFTQNNPGTNVLTGANTFTGATTVSSGTLQLGDGTSGHDGSIASSPTLEDDSSLVFNLYGNSSYGGTINGSGTVTKNGPGTLTLTNQSTYSGNTTINGGELVGATYGACYSTAVTVASPSATLGIVPVDNASSWQCYSLTFAAAGTLDFNFGSVIPSTSQYPLQITGDLDFNVTPTVIVRGAAIGASLPLGSYPLVEWGGNLNGRKPTSVILPPGMAGNLTTNSGQLFLNVTTATAQPFFWATNSGVWDINTSTNWLDANGVAQTYQQNISGGDAVVFNDTASGTGPGITVTVATGVTPVSLTLSNVAKSFTFKGAGGLTGSGSVTQVGATTNTFATTNNYTGPTTVSAGTLLFQGNGALSSGTAISLGTATLRVRSDGTASNGTIAQGNNITLSVVGSTDTIDVGNNGSANINNTVAFGALNNGTTANAFNSTLNFTGTNGYLQSYTSLGLSGSTGNGTTLNPTTTSVIITGNVMNQEYGSVSGHYDTLTLGGTSIGNAIYGLIADNVNYASVGNGDTRVTMSGTGIWTLKGNSTYHGPTTISAGILEADSSTALGVSAVTMSGGTLSNNVSATLANSVTLSSTGTIGVGSGQTLTLSWVLGSTGGLTKTGAGTLSLTGANTYAGTTTLSVGTLQIGGAGSLNSGNYAGNIAIASGTTLKYSSSAAQTLSGILSGTGLLVKDTSSGTLALSGTASTFTGSITVNAGTLDLQHPPLTTLGTVTVAGGALLQLDVAATNQVGALVLNGISLPNGIYNSGNSGGLIAGAGSLLVVHQDVWTGVQSSEWSTRVLSPSKNWAVQGLPTDYADGDPVTFDDTLTGNSTVNLSLANVSPGSVTFNNNKTNYTLQGSASIAGRTGLTMTGTGTVTIANTNTYTGTNALSAGIVQFKGPGALPSGSLISPSGTATLQILTDGAGSGGTIAVTNNITLSAASSTITNSVGNNGSGNINNTVAFGALNNGATNNTFSSTINFTAANGYLQSYSSLGLSGSTGNGTTLNPTTTSVIIAGNVINQEFGTVSGHYDTLTLNGTSTGNAINGVIADNVNYASVGNGDTRITKSGTSTWTLTGNNTYHGPTAISGGTLLVNNLAGSGTGASTVSVNSGGTLGGTGTIAGAVTNFSGGTLAPGSSGSGTLTISGTLVLNAGSTNTFAINGSTPANTSVALGGAVTYGGILNIVANGTFTLGQTFTLFSGAGAVNTGNFASLQSTGNNNNPVFAFTNGVLSVVPAPPTLTNFYFPGFGYAFPDATGTNFTIVVPGSTAVTALAPTYSLFVGTVGSPASGTPLDFTTPQTYTATAPGGASQAYKVTVKQAAPATGYQEVVLASSPISYWPLNETSGTTAFDIASGLNNMTYNLATLNQPGLRSDGNPSVALLTNTVPTDELYVGCPFNRSLNPSTFSIESWILVSNLTAQYLISTQDRPDNTPYGTNMLVATGGRWGYAIQKNNGGSGFTVTVGNAAAPTSSTSVNGTTVCAVGGVYHVVATYDGSTLKLYVNGNLDGSTSVAYQPATVNDPAFSIGSRFGNTSGYCRMQDVALYGRALTPQEIQTHLVSSPLFQYVNTGTSLTFTWLPTGGTLQGSMNVAGAYTNVPGATSPWTVPITPSVTNAFWRVKF